MTPPNFCFGDLYHCTYCGARPDDYDHVIPVSSYLDGPRKSYSGGTKTHACKACNTALGNRHFDSFHDRVAFANEAIIKKSQKFSRDASWSDEEICELDHTLRTFVASRQLAMQAMDSRASWFGSYDYYNNLSGLSRIPYLDRTHAKYKEWLAHYFRGYLNLDSRTPQDDT